MKKIFLFLFLTIISANSCSLFKPELKVKLEAEEIAAAKKCSIPEDEIKVLKAKKLYEFTPKELGKYLGFVQEVYPSLNDRVQHYAQKNIGQIYQIFLLGEYPFELYDADPLFYLQKSDCLVFSEHVYAMALAKDWPQFFSLLQRIRYKDGEISTVTRNHSTIEQWDPNNKWLLKDITEEIAAGMTKPIQFEFDPNKEIIADYGLNPGFPKEQVSTTYIPLENMDKVIGKLKKGDFVNVIRGFEEPNLWCGHVGVITETAGVINFLDSTNPKVQENPIAEVVKKGLDKKKANIEYNEWVKSTEKDPGLIKPERKYLFFTKEPEKPKKRAVFYGFKFLRPEPDPIKNLIEIDGKDAPKVTGPRGLLTNRKDIPATK